MIDPLIDRSILAVHVMAGFTALLVAPAAMILHKGSQAHRRWGKVYFWAMFVVFVTALGVMVYRPNPFLLFIAVLSFYVAFSGYRVLRRKRPEKGQRATPLDWVAAVAALAAGLGFIGWGAGTLLGLVSSAIPTPFSFLALLFGGLLTQGAGSDLRRFVRPPSDRNWWWFDHMQGMLGSYIAAVTAFLVQNVGRQLPLETSWIVWVTPALVGGVGIAYWVRHYHRKFVRRAPVQPPAVRAAAQG